jgi:hypothetical protein
VIPSRRIENMTIDLTTDGENPVITAKNKKRGIMIKQRNVLPELLKERGRVTSSNIP